MTAMKKITERDYRALLSAGKVLSKRKYYTEDVRTANAIRQVVVMVRRLLRKNDQG
jgi:hypothetical protein